MGRKENGPLTGLWLKFLPLALSVLCPEPALMLCEAPSTSASLSTEGLCPEEESSENGGLSQWVMLCPTRPHPTGAQSGGVLYEVPASGLQ